MDTMHKRLTVVPRVRSYAAAYKLGVPYMHVSNAKVFSAYADSMSTMYTEQANSVHINVPWWLDCMYCPISVRRRASCKHGRDLAIFLT